MKEQLRQRDSTIERLHQHEQQLTQLILQLQQQQLGQQPQLQMDQQPNANPQVHHEYQPPQQHITEPVQIELIEQQQQKQQQKQKKQKQKQKQKKRQRQQQQQQQKQQDQEERVWARWDQKGEMKHGFPARVTDDNGNVWKFKRPNWRSGILTWRRWIKGKGANSQSAQMKSALIKEGEDRVLLIKPQTFANWYGLK